MTGRYLLDTNIFIYTFDAHARDKNRKASQLVQESIVSGKGVVSYQIVQEFFNVALRKFNPPMSTVEAQQYFTTVFRPLLAVHSSAALYLEAFQLHDHHKLSWYDALIVAAAVQSQCTTLYSEDLQAGRRFGPTQVTNPFL